MPVFGLHDLRALCRDTGVPVSFNGVARYPDTGELVMGLFEVSGQDAVFNQTRVEDQIFTLELPYNAFNPMPVVGEIVVVGDGPFAGAYAVRSRKPVDDGGTTLLELRGYDS